MIRQSFELHESFYGAHHPKTLISVHNVGWLLMHKTPSRLVEAERMFQRTLLGEELLYGLSHFHSRNTASWLKLCYQHQGKHREAADLELRCAKAQASEQLSGSLPLSEQMCKAMKRVLRLNQQHSSINRIQQFLIQKVVRPHRHRRRLQLSFETEEKKNKMNNNNDEEEWLKLGYMN